MTGKPTAEALRQTGDYEVSNDYGCGVISQFLLLLFICNTMVHYRQKLGVDQQAKENSNNNTKQTSYKAAK